MVRTQGLTTKATLRHGDTELPTSRKGRRASLVHRARNRVKENGFSHKTSDLKILIAIGCVEMRWV